MPTDYFNDAETEAAPPPEETPTNEESSDQTFTLPTAIDGGEELAEGDTITLTIVKKHADSYEVQKASMEPEDEMEDEMEEEPPAGPPSGMAGMME